ncbi:MAG TPA: type II toxin-antitoxin system VapC family toxin [Thermoanaerobaculia bacterium]|nr:type II toxin-antitoxin system VapC family toxin [Thermoanaerobaculia bacterium]
MGVLIDSSVLIRHERGRLDLESRLVDRREEEVFLSVITASELLHGIHRAGDPAIRARRSAFVEAVLARFPLLGIDLATARIHAQIGADLMSSGTLIGPNDLWLAATCIAHGLSIATGNVREFNRVPGLSVESWLS